MRIDSYPLGQLQANCYFLTQGNDCIIIDPGDSADFILEKIQRERLNLVALLATHGHFDHIMAVGEIQLSYDVPLYIHDDDLFLVKRLNETAKHFLGYDPAAIPPKKMLPLTPGVGEFSLNVIHTPGHTPGSCSFYIVEENSVFTGDTLFKQGIGNYDHSYSDKKVLFSSLKTLFALPEETIVCPGHEDVTTIGDEKLSLQFS